MKKSVFLIAGAVAAALILPASAAVRIEQSTVNKSIRVEENESAGNLDSVNGSIRVGDYAVAGSVESVNGSIRIGEGAQVRSVDSVNGGVHLGRNVTVDGSLETVNGGIDAAPGVRIVGSVATVNGTLDLDQAIVEGDVTTYNGAVRLRDGTTVAGDLHVKKSRGSSWNLFGGKNKPTEVEIGEDTIIEGNLYFERPVRLRIGAGARYGEIHGDEVEITERK